MMEARAVPPRLQDPLWWAACLAAPAFWGLLSLVQPPSQDWAWPLRAPWLFCQVALLMPVLEEMVFRGGLQDWISSRWSASWRGVSLANVVTSLVFAAMHLWAHPPLWAASVFFPSLVFGFFYQRHRGLLSPIALHVGYNTGYFWLFTTLP